MSRESMFGPFASAFMPGKNSTAAYLELLNMAFPANVQVAITCIETALEQGDSARWIAALLGEMNWRPNLVAAVALLLDSRAADCALVWEAIDRASWVVPQLVIAAVVVDPMFRERIRERVAATTNPKLVASAVAVCAELPDLAAWRADTLREQRVIELLATDATRDDSGGIVASWLAKLRLAFAARGRTLHLG